MPAPWDINPETGAPYGQAMATPFQPEFPPPSWEQSHPDQLPFARPVPVYPFALEQPAQPDYLAQATPPPGPAPVYPSAEPDIQDVVPKLVQQKTNAEAVSEGEKPSYNTANLPSYQLETGVPQAPKPTGNPYEDAARQTEYAGQLEAAKQRAEQPKLIEAGIKRALEVDTADRANKKFTEEVNTRRMELRKEADEVANTNIDPTKYFKDAGTAKTVAWTLSALISGFLDPRGENKTIALLSQQVDKDIAAQLANRANKQAGVNTKRTLLQDDIAMGKDAYEAALKHSVGVYEGLARQAEQMGSKFNAPKAQANAAIAAAQLRAEGQKRQDILDQQVIENKYKQQNVNLGYAQIDASREREMAQQDREDKRLQAQADAAAVKLNAEQRKLVVPGAFNKDGSPVIAPDEQVATKVKDFKIAQDEFDTRLGDLIELKKKLGTTVIGDGAKKLDQARAKVLNAIKAKEKIKGAPDPESSLLPSWLGGGNIYDQMVPSASGPINNIAVFERLRSGIGEETRKFVAGQIPGFDGKVRLSDEPIGEKPSDSRERLRRGYEVIPQENKELDKVNEDMKNFFNGKF